VDDPSYGNVLLEHTGSSPRKNWASIDSGVAAFSASQVQADTVFDSAGSNLYEYSAGNWTKLKGSGVTGFQAGKGGDGKAAVFAVINGDLQEYVGSKVGWFDLHVTGITSFSASQLQADTVFTDAGGTVQKHAGRTSGGWVLIL